MYYENRYLFRFESSNGKTREIRVLHKEAGDRAFLASSESQLLTDSDGAYLVVRSYRADQRAQGRAPVLKKQQNGPIHGTSLTFYAECLVDREFMVFYTSDPKEYRVDVYEDATLLWQGYITPELYSEPDIAPPYDVEVVATDGIGELKLYNYEAMGTLSLRALLTHLLGYTGLSTDVFLVSSLAPGSRSAGALLDMTINLDYMEGKSCYDVLTYLLETLHATITWWKGAWILSRETNVILDSGKVRYYDTAGSQALLPDSVQALGQMRVNPVWPVGQLSTVIDPAKNKVTVQAPWHVVTPLRNPDMTSRNAWGRSGGSEYANDGFEFPQAAEMASIRQVVPTAGLRAPMKITLKATALTSMINTSSVCMVVVTLSYQAQNVTWYLNQNADGALIWQQESLTGPLSHFLTVWDASRIDAEEFSFDGIPPFLQSGAFPGGDLTVVIYGFGVRVYSAHLDITLPKGYKDIIRIDNGARGEGGEVEIAIGRETADSAYYAAFLQGLLLDTGSVITSFADTNFPDGMDYLSFIARDYALSVALPRARVKGTVYLEDSIIVPPLVFSKGGLDYWLQTWSWNMYEDELEIDALTIPSAQLTVLSETILESSESKV